MAFISLVKHSNSVRTFPPWAVKESHLLIRHCGSKHQGTITETKPSPKEPITKSSTEITPEENALASPSLEKHTGKLISHSYSAESVSPSHFFFQGNDSVYNFDSPEEHLQ